MILARAVAENSDVAPTLRVVEFDALKTYPDVLEVLKLLTEQAESGELIGLAITTVRRDRSLGSVFTEGCKDNIFLTLGAVTYLQKRLLNFIEEL